MELKVYLSVDERIVLKLQEEGKLFKKETTNMVILTVGELDKPSAIIHWILGLLNQRQQRTYD